MAPPGPPTKRPCIGNETPSLFSILPILAQTGSIGAREAGRIESTSTATSCDEEVWKGICYSRWTDTCILSSQIENSSAGYKASFRHRALQELVLLELPWIVNYQALRQLHSEHGHCRISHQEGNDQELADWLQAQRLQYRRYRRGEDTNMTQDSETGNARGCRRMERKHSCLHPTIPRATRISQLVWPYPCPSAMGREPPARSLGIKSTNAVPPFPSGTALHAHRRENLKAGSHWFCVGCVAACLRSAFPAAESIICT